MVRVGRGKGKGNREEATGDRRSCLKGQVIFAVEFRHC